MIYPVHPDFVPSQNFNVGDKVGATYYILKNWSTEIIHDKDRPVVGTIKEIRYDKEKHQWQCLVESYSPVLNGKWFDQDSLTEYPTRDE